MHCLVQYLRYGDILLNVVNHNYMHKLGLTVWEPRDPLLIVEPLRINARCAILLFADEDQKILHGMLSVLELSADQMMLLKVKQQYKLLLARIESWQPSTVLQLSMDVPALDLSMHVSRTYSPNFLAQNIRYKAEAYKELLSLRKIIHGKS